jgi:hypothetical protein
MWFLAVRILNYKIDYIAKTADLITVGIISGPREPKTLQYYSYIIVQELLLLNSSRVTIPETLPDGTQVTRLVLAFLVALIGDYPALCKILNRQGVNSKLACIKCWVEGHRLTGLRQCNYDITDEADNEHPMITTGEMKRYGSEAQSTGEKVYGFKGPCLYTQVLGNLPWFAAIDIAHCIYNYFKTFIKLMKNKVTLSAYKKPKITKSVAKKYPDGQYPAGVKAALNKKIKEWEKRVAAQEAKRTENNVFKMTDKTQDWMDTLYRWCAGAGDFGHPSRRPFQWTGTMNIHNCKNWWVTKICLYMTYPFVREELFQVIKGFHEILKRLFQKPIDQTELRRYRPTMLTTLQQFYKVVPANFHGILIHGLKHVYDLLMETGTDALALAMFIFERIVAWYNRHIHCKNNPEENLVGNIDFRNGLLNSILTTSASFSSDEWQEIPVTLRKALDIPNDLFTDQKADNEHNEREIGATRIPTRIRHGHRVQFKDLPRHPGYPMFEKIQEATRVNHTTQIYTSVVIRGIRRNTIRLEPPIGSVTEFRRRSSGFARYYKDGNHEYGQITDVYAIPTENSDCILKVNLYPVEYHSDSTLERVMKNKKRIAYVLASSLSEVIVFVPWFDKFSQKGKSLKPNREYYCTLPTNHPLLK